MYYDSFLDLTVHYHNILSVVEFPFGNAVAKLFNDAVIVQYCEESMLDDMVAMSCTEVGCTLLFTVDDMLAVSCTEVGCMLMSTVDDILVMSCTEVGYMFLSTVDDIIGMFFTTDVLLFTITYDTESHMINCIISLIDTVKPV